MVAMIELYTAGDDIYYLYMTTWHGHIHDESGLG